MKMNTSAPISLSFQMWRFTQERTLMRKEVAATIKVCLVNLAESVLAQDLMYVNCFNVVVFIPTTAASRRCEGLPGADVCS